MHHSFDLNKHRKLNPGYIPKTPFEHQKDAFANLSKLYNFDSNSHKSGILVLPTGAGKTFTSINWICRNILPKNLKIVWLAHTSHLLNQAYKTFEDNLLEIHSREHINIRVVSSDPMHSSAASIELSDDIVIITTQTAISNWNPKALDGKGGKVKTAFEKYIINSKKFGLFLVLDEAHHAPAYGCRNLLIGGSKGNKGIRDVLPTVNFLGLTATPTYNDESRRGWLFNIFNTDIFKRKGIIYEVEKEGLIKQGILATPNYIQKNTGEEYEVDDRDYNHIVREHNDLPIDIVERLAKDSGRNDYIVDEYVKSRKTYGKTIIFADRWYQCIYLKEKLKEKGVKVDAVYSHVEASESSAEERNKRTPVENSKILEKFKNNQLDVLINVKMLTEGTDVPDVETVFITRQTTSSILLTQMIGRALRGKRAGARPNKDVANIVFFVDNWNRVLNFASPDEEGLLDDSETRVRGRYPVQYIAINLIEDLSRKIDSGIVFSDQPYLDLIPVGWYETEVLIDVQGETSAYKEYIIVYQNTQHCFINLVDSIDQELSPIWEDESLDLKSVQPLVTSWVERYFGSERHGSHQAFDLDVIKIARHIAQTKEHPRFYSFADRDKHDLSKFASEIVRQRMDDLTIDDLLIQEFQSSDRLWQSFYRDYNRFCTAFDSERRRAIHQLKYGSTPGANLTALPDTVATNRELTEKDKEMVFKRDNYKCLCCGKEKTDGKRIRLEVDHIIPVKFGGQTTFDNSQTLCDACNKAKGVNEINFRVYKTPLSAPKNEITLLDMGNSEFIEWGLQRIVNSFYHCQAVSGLKIDVRPRSKYRYHWEIELYSGNPPEWIEVHNNALINHIHESFGYEALKSLTFK
jgi:superfamily II DNA or RNA helicase